MIPLDTLHVNWDLYKNWRKKMMTTRSAVCTSVESKMP